MSGGGREQQPTRDEQLPDLESFRRFLAEVSGSFPSKRYVWSRAKARSADWLIERVPAGTTGVDVGGTEYLCRRLAKKGCRVTFFDLVPPRRFATYITDDMFNVMRHFDPRSLDFIVTRHTLEHAVVPMYQLWAYNQLLRDDGRLLVTVPAYHDQWVWMATHFSCVPPDSWHMLFHRTGFDIEEFQIGTWNPARPEFVEHRFVLRIGSRTMRLKGRPQRTLRSHPDAIPQGRAISAEAEPDAATGRARLVRTLRWPRRGWP